MQFIIAFALTLVIFLLLFVIISAVFFAIDVFLDLPYVATKKEKIATIIKFANIKSGETVVDLGSGDGRLLFAAAQRGAHAIGYEINPFLVFLTRLKARLLHFRGEVVKNTSEVGSLVPSEVEGDSSEVGSKGHVIVRRQNLWQADLEVADVIFVYGRAKTMQKFQDFVYKNAQKGTRIVVNTNPFPNKNPLKSANDLFLYQV